MPWPIEWKTRARRGGDSSTENVSGDRDRELTRPRSTEQISSLIRNNRGERETASSRWLSGAANAMKDLPLSKVYQLLEPGPVFC